MSQACKDIFANTINKPTNYATSIDPVYTMCTTHRKANEVFGIPFRKLCLGTHNVASKLSFRLNRA